MRRLITILVVTTALFGATIKTAYRATNTAVTITSLVSLANSTTQATGIAGSAFVDNTTNLDIDEIVTVVVKTGASGVSSTGTAVIYVYGCVGGTSVCTDGVTGTDATQTLTNPTNLLKVVACNTVANATVYNCGPFSIANQFGGIVPARWGVVIQNLSGAALSASGSSVVYDSIQMTSN